MAMVNILMVRPRCLSSLCSSVFVRQSVNGCYHLLKAFVHIDFHVLKVLIHLLKTLIHINFNAVKALVNISVKII
ncbi:MAG: hypothetical protein QM498_06050, partial [Desulfobacterium sp.]